MSRAAAEAAKYAEIWSIDAYGDDSPGRQAVELFERVAAPSKGDSILDIGAGAGAASRALADKGYRVAAVDLTDTAWKHADIPLSLGPIWKAETFPRLRPVGFRYGFCCDVMEHIPTEFVALSIANILQAVDVAFFSISFEHDNFGAFIGQPLHLTVREFVWWRDVFRELGTLLDARDRIGQGIFLVTR